MAEPYRAERPGFAMEEYALKYILRGFMLCAGLLMSCFSAAIAEDHFHLVFPCESGTVVSATVSEAYGYAGASVHVQYPVDHLPDSAGEITVEGIEIDGKPYSLEVAEANRYASGSRVNDGYRITDFSGETMDSVSLMLAEHLADGERLYTLDLPHGEAKWTFEPAIVRASTGGLVYAAPSASSAAIGHLHDGAKLTVYFGTEDGWAAVGAGSREAEMWGYMRMQDLCFEREEDDVHRLTSGIEQGEVQDGFTVYGDAGCTRALHEVQSGDWVSVLGCAGDSSFIQTGPQYGYVPTETLRSHSHSASTSSALVYRADVRGALVTVLRDQDCRIAAAYDYTPQYTVNDDIRSLAVYVNGDRRYVLSQENDFSVRLPRGDAIASLVVVPIWASGGELIEDAVVVPLGE